MVVALSSPLASACLSRAPGTGQEARKDCPPSLEITISGVEAESGKEAPLSQLGSFTICCEHVIEIIDFGKVVFCFVF